MIRLYLICFAILGSCSSPTYWKLDSIATGIEAFDSVRLMYEDTVSPLRFEIVRLESGIEAFLSLTRYKFISLENVKIEFDFGGEKVEETLPFLEGKMRIRFPTELTQRLINALQEGKEVVMIVDGSEQHLSPEQFAKQYKKLEAITPIFQNPFKGLFDP